MLFFQIFRLISKIRFAKFEFGLTFISFIQINVFSCFNISIRFTIAKCITFNFVNSRIIKFVEIII